MWEEANGSDLVGEGLIKLETRIYQNAMQRCLTKTLPLRSGLVHRRVGMHGGTHGDRAGNVKK